VEEDGLLEIVYEEGSMGQRKAMQVRAVEWGGNCGASVQDISPVASTMEQLRKACPPLDASLSWCPRTDHSGVMWDGYGEWGRRRLK